MIQALRPIWPPAAILVAAVLSAWTAPPLPDTLAGLSIVGPYALLIAAAAVSVWFNRGRAFVIALSLLAAFAAYQYFTDDFAYTALALLVPLNALAALALSERGARFGGAWRWLALIALEAALFLYAEDTVDTDELLDNFFLRSPPTPLAARLVFAAAFCAAVWRAWPHHTPLELGAAGALTAFFIACEWIESQSVFATFMSASGVILLVAVLQESYRLAFRDALTGLPNRRALEEQLRALEPPYALAMVDVDHFKKFNDAHGHDIGDQVLRLVAARLAEVGGGGRAFRYGGEEFTLLFPGRQLAETLPHLEATRASVEMYKMTIRGKDRPKDKETGAKLRSHTDFERTDQFLSVTVSIGAAEPGKRLKTQREVLKGADEALYRAKERGRNQLSR